MKKLLVFYALLLLAVSSAQGGFSISGTLFARAGSSLSNTYVIGCYIVNDDCDEQGSEVVQVSSNSSSAQYTLGGLVQNREYLMLAWRDLNNNQEVDKGDELGVSQSGGKPVEIKAPAQKIDLRLALFNGDFDALLDQADQPPALTKPATLPTQTGALVLSGAVRALAGSSLSNTVVVAGVWENGNYNQNRSKAVSINSAGQFNLTGLENIKYVLFAWRDLDNNNDVSPADEVAPYRVNGKVALVTPPVQNITLQFEKGDSSLDQMIALTAPNANSNPPVNTQPNNPPVNTQQPNNPPVPVGNDPCPQLPKLPVQPEPNFIKGVVVDRCGKPIANANVTLSRPGISGGIDARTNEKGEYRMRAERAYYDVWVQFARNVGGINYTFCADPHTKETPNGLDGGVVNFVWHAGKKLSATPNEEEYFGSGFKVSVYDVFSKGGELPQGSKVVLTVTPVGVMADGYATRAISRTVTTSGDQFEGFEFKGVPFGKWRIRADVTFPDGRQFWYPMKLSTSPFEAKGTRDLEFSTLPPQGSVSCLGGYGGSDVRIEMTVN